MAAAAGFNLLEITVVLALLFVALVALWPRIDRLTRNVRLEAAAGEVAATLRWARQKAAMRGANVGLKFYPGPEQTTFALYADGDFDGVRTGDIETQVDPELVAPRPLEHLGRDIRFGIPVDHRGRPPREPNQSRRLDRVDDPIRFNRSDIASFGRGGTATPGTIYLTDGVRAFAVRVYNRTGRVGILRYDPRVEVWR